jgi:DNA-binding MarR family transcriptional regulator
MGVLNDIFGAAKDINKKRLAYVVVITDLGKDKLEKPGVSTYQWRILNFLAENGPSPIRDIATAVDMPEERVKATCKSMADDGFIMRRNTGGSD